MSSVYLGLVHFPVLNKHRETVQTAVTNLDIHDIARSAETYGVKRYFLITPDKTQKEHVGKVAVFWQSTAGRTYNRDRSEALEILEITDSIEASVMLITTQEDVRPIVISTTARIMENQLSHDKLRLLYLQDRPLLLLFGTGHGLADEVHAGADRILQPITGLGRYNHLSVRSAVAIVLDRMTSRCI